MIFISEAYGSSKADEAMVHSSPLGSYLENDKRHPYEPDATNLNTHKRIE